MTRRARERAVAGERAKQAVIYARVSSKEQEKEGYSIPAQLELLRRYASQHSLTVASEFVDVETAKQSGRVQFGDMLAFLETAQDCRIVLVEKTDRLSRNLKDCVALDELDLELHFVKENFVYSRHSRSSEKFFYGIRVLMAKQYIDNLAEETSKGMREKASQGLWPSYAPLGYRNAVSNAGRKVIEPDPERAPVVAKLFEWCATGEYSLRQLADKARSAGLTSRQGSLVRTSNVHRVLRKRIYSGDFDWDGDSYRGSHAPLVSMELWDKAQRVLDAHSGSGPRKRKHEFAFSGLIKCGHCGCSLVGEIKKERYVYYHCTGHKGKCGERYTREEVLEERFGELLNQLHIDDERVEWIAEALRRSHKDKKRHHEEAILRLQSRYNRLQKRIEAMYVDKLDGSVDDEFFKRKSKEWLTEQDRVQLDIGRHQAASEAYIEEGVRILELAARAHELFIQQDPREKRRLLNFLVSNCTWANGELSAEFRQPFDMLAVAATSHREKKAAGLASDDLSATWYPRQDSNLRQPV